MDSLQLKYLHSETIFKVNEKDCIVGRLSKYEAHRIGQQTGKAPLHRAFSVFLWNGSGQLLIQKRSEKKITFPLMWANSCCSHPIAEIEGEEDGLQGVIKAARRKLEHELGIPYQLFNQTDFKFFGKVLYDAPASDGWGEHEVDYILFAKLDDEGVKAININENEVAEYKFLALDQLNELPVMTPWLRMIYQTGSLKQWFELFSRNLSVSSSNEIKILK